MTANQKNERRTQTCAKKKMQYAQSSACVEAADGIVDKECEQSRKNMQGKKEWKFLTRASPTGVVQASSVSFEHNHNLVT